MKKILAKWISDAAKTDIIETHTIATFAGTTIPDDSSVKAGMESLETAVEARALDSVVIKKDGSVAYTAAQSMGGFKLTSLAAPTADGDAATKKYVDDSASGIQSKAACQLATTANITLSGEQTIDGVLTSASRILVKDQTTASENGIYVTAAGAWVRSDDTDGTPASEVQGGMLTFVTEGTANIDTSFRLTGTGDKIVGTDSLDFILYSRAEATSASLGLTKVGLDFRLADAVANASGIKVLAGAITLEDLSAFNTDGLSEGSTNLYYTTARFTTDFGTKTTTDLTEGTNLYYTTARFTTAFGTKTTTDLAEGTNLYFTDARAKAASVSDVIYGISWDTITDVAPSKNAVYDKIESLTTTDVTEGTNLYYTSGRFTTDFGTKTTTDLAEGTNLYYSQARFDTAFTGKDTDALSEGATNLYFTNARAKAASVSDTVYGVSWDAVTDVAPSKNAVYDKIESLASASESRACDKITLASLDITNKYVDLTGVPVDATCVSVTVMGGIEQEYGVEFTIITDGSSLKRLIWDSANAGVTVGMVADLAAADTLKIEYSKAG